MKKSLVALAALAVVGAASAQSSVTLFGVVDATVAYGSGDNYNRTRLTNSGYNSSRLGFKGVEDLGGGMKAGFWLEAGVNNDDGSLGATNTNNQATGSSGSGGLTFNRRSTVSLMGNFGEFRLGRDYTPQFWSQTVYDPFGTNGVGTTRTLLGSVPYPGGVTAVRASNSIAYLSPAMGGFGVWVQGYMGENASNVPNSSAGNGGAIRITYDGGPLSAALAFSQTNVASDFDLKSTNIGLSYNLGMATLEGLVTKDSYDGWADDINGYLLGALVPMGPGTIRVAFSGSKQGDYKTDQFAIGYVYDLSKRTSLYGTFATVNNGGGAAAALNGASTSVNGSSNGVDLGIKHSF